VGLIQDGGDDRMQFSNVAKFEGILIWHIAKNGTISQCFYNIEEKFSIKDCSVLEVEEKVTVKVAVEFWEKGKKKLRMHEFSLTGIRP